MKNQIAELCVSFPFQEISVYLKQYPYYFILGNKSQNAIWFEVLTSGENCWNNIFLYDWIIWHLWNINEDLKNRFRFLCGREIFWAYKKSPLPIDKTKVFGSKEILALHIKINHVPSFTKPKSFSRQYCLISEHINQNPKSYDYVWWADWGRLSWKENGFPAS